MLSISPIASSASGAAAYYLSEEKDLNLSDVSLEKDEADQNGNTNYYLKEQSAEPNTQWFGKLAQQEGMLGKPVEEQQLTNVLAGELNGDSLKVKNDNARNGFDFTFSAPKSVSLLALVGGDKRLITAHDEAVKFALTHIEKDAAQARQTDPTTKATSFENTGNLLFAMVRHKTSRESDPQLHTHSLTANMTRDSQGALRALASSFKQKGGIINGTGERVYNHQKYYTSLYQSALARSVEQMGYQTRPMGNNLFEVQGVPQDLIDSFSTRSQQIKEQTQSMGLDSQAAKDVAAKDTRKAKEYTAESTLISQWTSKATQGDFSLTEFAANSMSKAQSEPQHDTVLPAALDAVNRAISHSSNTQNILSYAKLIEAATTHFTQGEKLNAISIKLALDLQIQQGALIPLDKEASIFTTQAQIDSEAKLLKSIEPKTVKMRQVIDSAHLQGKGLNSDNQKKIVELFASTKQVNLVNVFGSSEQLATALLHVGEANGKHVHIVTPDQNTEQQTQKAVSRDSSSIVKWIANHFKPSYTHTLANFNNNVTNTNRDLIVVENANKLGTSELQTLITQAQQGNSKLVLLNHANAKQGMKAGNAIEVLKKGNIHQSNWVATKQSDTQLTLRERSDVERVSAIAKAYADLPHKHQTQVVASTHKDVKQLNTAIRTELQNRGDVSRLGVNIPTLNPVFMSNEQREVVTQYSKGMVLTSWGKVAGRNQKQTLTIDKVNRENNTLTVVNINGEKSELNPNTKAFKTAQYSVSRPDTLHIAKGDSLYMTSNHHDSGLNKQYYTVTELTPKIVTVVDSEGKFRTVKAHELHNAPLNHGYAATPTNINANATHHIVNIKAYSASKEWLHETLTQGVKRIDVYTDKLQQFDDRLEKSEIKPSSINRIMQSTDAPEKFVNSQTSALLLQDVSQSLAAISDQHTDKGLVHNAVEFALNHISEKEAGFTHKELVSTAIRYAFEEKNTSITKAEIETKLQQFAQTQSKHTPQPLSAEYHDGTRWTTQAAIDTETRILDRFNAGKGQVSPLISSELATQALNENTRLTDGQKDATLLITTTKDRFVAIQGLAGTGKSTMLETGIALVHHSEALLDKQQTQTGKNTPKTTFIGLAPTHAAVNELKDKNVASQTVQSLLSNFLSQEPTPNQYANTVFLLDESSMTGNAQMDKFTQLIESTGARAVFIGDKFQLTAQEAGKPFELAMSKGAIDSVIMKDIKRQQNDTLLGAVHNIIDRQGESAIDKIQQQSSEYQISQTSNYKSDPVENSQHQDKNPPPDKQHNKHTQNIISTLKPITGDTKKDQQLATEALPTTVALEYLSRTPAARENTLIIAYTNKERDDITHEIRPGLQQQGTLSEQEKIVTRLRGVHASKDELATMMPYQQGLILSTSKDNYFEITNVDKRHNMLTLADMTTGEEKFFYPKNHGHKFTNLWTKSEQPLAAGDKIMLRKSDIEREMEGNKTYSITTIDDKSMKLTSSDNHTLTLSTTQLKDAHWDYAYTRTADMAQGATYNNVITSIKGNAKLTNIRRAMIDITRASQHVKIITDNPKKMMLSWINNDPNKASALETRDKHYPEHSPLFNDKPLPQENPKYQDINGNLDIKQMTAIINEKLPAYTESLAARLLSDINKDKSDKDALAFEKDGNIKVTTTGQYRGYFKDWKTGDKGSLINLIMLKENCNFKEALFKADAMLAEPEKFDLTKNDKHQQLKDSTPIKQSQLEARALQYYNESKPLSNTPAELYLKQLGIVANDNDNVRFHNDVYSSETRKTYPALIANITNNKGETKAVEVTYLDNDGNQPANLKVAKRILGSKSGNHTSINKANNTNYSIIAVGVENALIINSQNKDNADIIALTNNNDAKTIKLTELRDNVIVVLDKNITQDTTQLTTDITSKLANANKHAIIIEPSKIPEGLNKGEITNQLVNEAIDSITTKNKVMANSIKSLNSDMANINTKENHEPSSANLTNRANDKYIEIAIDSQRETTKPISHNLEQSRLDIGEKTI